MAKSRFFRHLIRTRGSLNHDYLNYSFGFQTVFYINWNSFRYCSCAVDHEYFEYIDGNGDINGDMLEKLAKAVQDGYCPHAINVPKKYLQTAMVRGFHIAAALGAEEIINTYVGKSKGNQKLHIN